MRPSAAALSYHAGVLGLLHGAEYGRRAAGGRVRGRGVVHGLREVTAPHGAGRAEGRGGRVVATCTEGKHQKSRDV